VYPEEFFEDDIADPMAPSRLNTDLVEAVLHNRDIGVSDAEVGAAILRLTHDELEAYGTDGSERTNEREMRLMIRTSLAVAKRVGVLFDLPFRDYKGFRSYWLANDGYGSWQARRNLLGKLFDDAHLQMARLEDAEIVSDLAHPVTSHPGTGWVRVDVEINELRRHFQVARTEQDYRNIGNDCVATIERMSEVVFDPIRHLEPGEDEPPVAQTKMRLTRFVERAVPGTDNAELRKLARAVIELAQAVKHRESPTRRDAGIAADAVIQLANMLRRLQEPER
jgi:hypothetical protein